MNALKKQFPEMPALEAWLRELLSKGPVTCADLMKQLKKRDIDLRAANHVLDTLKSETFHDEWGRLAIRLPKEES